MKDYQYPKWLHRIFALFAANYGAQWTDKMSTEVLEEATYFLWYEALKDFPDTLIMQVCVDLFKTHKYPPCIAEFLETMRIQFRRMKEDAIDQKRIAAAKIQNPNEPQVSRETHPPLIAAELANHKLAMANIDKMRALVGLPSFDESKWKRGECVLNEKAQYNLNVMSVAMSRSPEH